ncbi:MAG: transglutaminaseTgpA domain-containing protein [Planctomycetaceae bacterium]
MVHSSLRNITIVLQISAHCLAGWASLMLGYAEGAVFPYLLTAPVLLFSYFALNRWPKLQLSPLVANVFGLLAFGLAAAGLFSDSIESRLLSGAHLLVILSWIVLLQTKNLSQYWWLFALAVLQVSVGSILTNRALYGLFLVVFLLLSVWTLSIFSLQQAAARFVSSTELEEIHSGANRRGTSEKSDEVPANEPAKDDRKTSPFLESSRVFSGIQLSDGNRWFSFRFLGGICGLTISALIIAMVFFLLIPRRWIGRQAWASAVSSSKTRTLVGFTENIQLGEMGSILESNERVMEIRIFDHDTNQQMDVEQYARSLGYDEPLFRGQVLDTYTRGRWTKTQVRTNPRNLLPAPNRGYIRQEIRLAPIGTHVLFAIRPLPIRPVHAARQKDSETPLTLQPIGSVLQRNRLTSRQVRLVYEVFTQTAENARRRRDPRYRTRDEISWSPYLSLPRDRLAKLRAEARRVSGYESAGERPSSAEMARRLVAYLRDSGTFQYSLTAKREQFSMDPVEEFLERKTGHCEYFATALALMLRAVDIPSRLVSGFKGGNINELSGQFEVEQRHAHAWVEAMIDGHWQVLDPTPADERNKILDGMGHFRSWKELMSLLTSLWNSYIVDINFNSQNQKVYTPLKKNAQDFWKSMTSETSGKSGRWGAIKAFLLNPKRWFSWQGGVIAFVLMLFGSFVYWAVRKLMVLWKKLGSERKNRRQSNQVFVEFYERFRDICAQQGLVRKSAETEREFVQSVSRTFRKRSSKQEFQEFLNRVPEVFYSVRFGHQNLTDHEYEQLQNQLTAFEKSLSHPTRTTG